MPRPPRIQYAGAWQHVMNRGASHHATFLDRADREAFLNLVGRAVDKFDVEVHGYCLMTNHYHLLLRTPDCSLDRAMQLIAGRYTRYFNDRHGRDGALFRGRYVNKVIDSDAYLLSASRYIHRNAADLGVARILDHPWSSYPAYVGQAKPPGWLRTGPILKMAGGAAQYEFLVEHSLDTSANFPIGV